MQVSLTKLALYLVATAANVMADSDYECVGTFIFGRHNDRNAKPAVLLSPLGAQHQYDMGSFFRERYYGMDNSGDAVESNYTISGLNEYGLYDSDEFYGEAVSSNVILFSHLSFLQGLYPPTTVTTTSEDAAEDVYAQLSNGTDLLGPLGGYQYVQSYIQESGTPDYIWIKGDSDCPNSDAAQDAWLASDAFTSLNESTFDFYQSLNDILPDDAYDASELNFGNAEGIFDYMNVNYIHNETLYALWNDSIVADVRILADKYTWGVAYNTSDKYSDMTIGAQTLCGAILTQLNTTKTESSPYINYYTGSFNTFFQFFGLVDLYEVSDNFTGMPDYGSVLVFELLKDTSNDYYVQFSFKNGSTSPYELTTYPLFNTGETLLSWDDFESNMKNLSITSLDAWCERCSATVDMCTVYSDLYEDAEQLESDGVSLDELADGNYTSLGVSSSSSSDSSSDGKSNLSNAAAGGIGAGVTLAVVLILAALAGLWMSMKNKKASKNITTETLPVTEKRVHTDNSSSEGTI